MARYIERAENIARLISVNTHLLLDLPRKASRPAGDPLIDDHRQRCARSTQHYKEPTSAAWCVS